MLNFILWLLLTIEVLVLWRVVSKSLQIGLKYDMLWFSFGLMIMLFIVSLFFVFYVHPMCVMASILFAFMAFASAFQPEGKSNA